MLYCHASSPECVNDSYARYVSNREIQALALPKNRDEVMAVDGYLLRARKLQNEYTAIPDGARLELHCKLMTEMAQKLLGKSKKSVSYEDILETYVAGMMQASGAFIV